MSEAGRKRIGVREVEALGPGGVVWDGAVAGFGARRQRESIAYLLKYRTMDGRQRLYTIGRHAAPWKPESARKEAQRLLGEVARGGDPAGDKQTKRKAATVAELCDLYMAEAEAGRIIGRKGEPKRASTIESDRGRLAHVKAAIGTLSVAAVTRQDIARVLHEIAEGRTATQAVKTKPRGVSQLRGGRGVATRTIGLLGAVFAFSIERGLREDNPVRGVRRFADGRRERRLADAEYAALAAALGKADGRLWPAAVNAVRFLAITGWRSGEALALRWSDVDLERRTAILADTKTGRSMRPLSGHARNLLREMPRIGTAELVFPPSRGNGIMSGFRSIWERIAALGELAPDVSPHVLRHSYASVAADLGYSEPTIAALIGHKGQTITSRYVHSADKVLIDAADAVAERIVELMAKTPPEIR